MSNGHDDDDDDDEEEEEEEEEDIGGAYPVWPALVAPNHHTRSTGRWQRRPGDRHHGHMPKTPDQHTRAAVTQRIRDHVACGWPYLGEPVIHYRGQFCYVAAVLPGHHEPSPILRLRYQGSADHWAIGIYLYSDERYTEAELPTSFGPKTGTPEQGIDATFVLYAGPGRQP